MSSEGRIIPMNREIRISALREQLMRTAVAYVREGKDGSERDRLRTASSLSGIPERTIENAIGSIKRIEVDNGQKS